jgi:hypothetical protein
MAAHQRLALLLFLILVTGIQSTTGHAQNPPVDCLPPYEEAPAAGEWTGQLRLVYQIGTRREVTATVDGDLSFKLARVSLEDPALPPPVNRRPLRAPGSTPLPTTPQEGWAEKGQFANDDEQRAAILRWYAEHPKDPTPDGDDDTITGTAAVRQVGELLTASSSGRLSLPSATTVRVEAKEESRDFGPPRFHELKLIAESTPRMTGTVTSQSGSAELNR